MNNANPRENDDWLLEELDTRSVSISQENLSQDSTSSGPSPSFKKHKWMNSYFEIRGRDKQSIFCKSCHKKFQNRSFKRLNVHLNSCWKITDISELQVDQPNTSTMLDGEDHELDQLWAMVTIENNIPLRCTDSKTFKKFVAKLRASNYWNIPTRQELSSLYIPLMARKLLDGFLKDISDGKICHLSIEFDHWEDAKSRSFLGVIATTADGTRYLLDLRDVSLKGHSSSVIVEELVDVLKMIPSNAINSIMSDSASCCKKARKEIVNKPEYSHVIHHRCMAHLFNNIGSRITIKNEVIATTINLASKITSFISSSSFWLAHIKGLNINRPRNACSVRWYSTVCMLNSLLELKSVILEDVLPNISREKAALIELLDWEHLTEILEVLRPLNACIGMLENKRITLGEAFGVVLNYAKNLFAPMDSVPDVLKAARIAFLWHFDPRRIGLDEFGILLAAYGLDRRTNFDFVTENGCNLALEAISRVAVRSGIGLQRVKTTVIGDFQIYRSFGENYKSCNQSCDPVSWWKRRLGNGTLAIIALKFAHLKASSANIERTFSALKLIQSPSRVNLSVSSLVNICRVKIKEEVILEEHDLEELDCVEVVRGREAEGGSQSMDRSTIELIEPSDITNGLSQNCSWLENESLDTKLSYQSFFEYIDFNLQYRCHTTASEDPVQISDADIRAMVQSMCGQRAFGTHVVENYSNVNNPQEMQNHELSYDSASQVAAYDELTSSQRN